MTICRASALPAPNRPLLRPAAILALAAAMLGACVTWDPGIDPGAVAGPRQEVLAPIEAVELITQGSDPPRYALRVTSGLPSGCAEHERIEATRSDELIAVSVWNTEPADAGVACTMIYRTVENTVALDGELRPGVTYEVHVNGEHALDFTVP